MPARSRRWCATARACCRSASSKYPGSWIAGRAEEIVRQRILPAERCAPGEFPPVAVPAAPAALGMRDGVKPVLARAADAFVAHVVDSARAARDEREAHDPVGADAQRARVDEILEFGGRADVELDQVGGARIGRRRRRVFADQALAVLPLPVAHRLSRRAAGHQQDEKPPQARSAASEARISAGTSTPTRY